MISLQSPLWLILLSVIPLIRWLHRFRQHSSIFPSTTLFLWQRSQHHSDSNGAPTKPDPRWLLRALITSLIILSLAEPFVQNKYGYSIEIWLDDSLSMFAKEDGRQRIQQGIEQLHLFLLESEASRIQVHSLGSSTSVLSLDPKGASRWASQLSAWTSLPRGEPSPPSPATLSPDSSHILLTDGADGVLNSWAVSAPLHRIIRVGNATQNIALTRLSLRESLNESDSINGIARIDNLGDAPQKTQLFLQQEEQVIEIQQLDVPASGKTITRFTIPAGQRSRLQARVVSTNDPLPLDNELQLDLERLNPRIGYEMPAPCGLHIMAVLDSHPAFHQDANQPEVIIDCTGQTYKSTQPTLRLHPTHSILQTMQPAHWHNGIGMDSLRMVAGLPYSDKAPALTSDAIPILSADGRQLILQRHNSGQDIDSFLNINDPAFAQRPEYPLLILGLIEQLTGRRLDNAPLTTTRDIDASRIRPAALKIMPKSLAEAQTTHTSLTSLLLLASLLLLLLDAALASRLVHELRKQIG